MTAGKRGDADAHKRLASYGTLQPGRENAHILDGIDGRWTHGFVRGHLIPEGWGATLGYPALIPDENGAEVPVQILHSDGLPEHWARIDEFEGEGYVRVEIQIHDEGQIYGASIYALAPPHPDASDIG